MESQMKNVIALLALSLMTVSCVNLEGRLNVSQVLNAKKRGGFLNLQMKSVAIQPGNYQANIKVNNAQSFTLKLKSDKEGSADILIPIKKETDFSIPTNGNIIIRGSEISQPFDLSGRIETNVTLSAQVRTIEECSIQRTENHCDKICSGGTAPAPGRPGIPPYCDIVCRDVLVTFPGTRFVEYHNRYIERNLSADLLDVENKSVLASFTGTDTDSNRITDYYGECR